jgi:hypothetical protein
MSAATWSTGVAALLAATSALAAPPDTRVPITVHPDNPRYFLFRGKPLVLVTATEHYGSVLNRAFDFDKYLDDAAERRMTLTRTFLLYRELQTPRNPSSPCKPESPDYLTPYPRTGPGKAIDGEPIFDLDQWNPEFFARLNRFLTRASERGIVVELTLFSHLYNDQIYKLSPLRAGNNKQGVGKGEWHEFDSLKDKALAERQAAFARKVVQETSGFDNVYYEICNEPAGGKAGLTSVAEVDAWLAEMTRVVRDELRKQKGKHLVFGTQAFDAGKMRQELQPTFTGKAWDAVNIHPHPYLVWQERQYPMGDFMAKELKLAAVRDFCRAVHPQQKPVILDEDNAASLYRDEVGWTIHRKRAWTAVLSGAHYDYIDFSVTVGNEAGTVASRKGIRAWFEHLSRLIHSFDFIHARPVAEWVSRKPEHLVCSALVVEGKDYIAYLADGRELTEQTAGTPIEGEVQFSLPAGTFHVSLISPMTGAPSPAMSIEGGRMVRMALPPFRQDVVIRATRAR